ncbi:MAG: META domain-containing protein [Halioglobus sp.]
MRTILRHLASVSASLLLVTALSACDNDPDVKTEYDHRWEDSLSSLDGTVFFRERIALPANAELEVQLLDLTVPSKPVILLSSGVITPLGAPPYDFSITTQISEMDRRKLRKKRYGLRATIRTDGRIMFANEDFVDPGSGAPKLMLLHRIPTPEKESITGLSNVHWGLQTLNGEMAPGGTDNRLLDIRFLAEQSRAAGFSGCNRYSGSYTLEDEAGMSGTLALGPMAGTRMACPQGRGDIEGRYLEMFNKVTAFRIEDGTLLLLADQDVLATFKVL